MILLIILCYFTTFSKAFTAAHTERNDDLRLDYFQPEQVHLAYGEKIQEIVVTWTTFNDTQESIVEYGKNSMDETATGYSTLFVDGGKLKRQMYIHRVTLSFLDFNTTYKYHVGSKYGWSVPFSFKTPDWSASGVVRAAIFGDMGNVNAKSLSYLQEEAQRDAFNTIIHVGDFAYDMDDDDALVGDEFMRQIEPLAALVPYMTCPGNHEEKYNFSNYKNRFSMPGNTESMFYSWNLGPVHFISISTEFYYFLNYGLQMVQNQYYWLVEDLKRANSDRLSHPWIIVYGHRPMYCSNKDDSECALEYTRVGLPIIGSFALEPLLKDYGVDLVIWAHEHSYERTWPLYDNEVLNGTLTDDPYFFPRAPVHIVTGSAGCQEGRDTFNSNPHGWSAFRSQDYGYSKLKVFNKTHLYWEQVSVDLDGQVIDSFWITKCNKTTFL